MQPEEKSEYAEHYERLDQLRGPEIKVRSVRADDRHTGVFVALFREMDTYRVLAHIAPAAPGGETALPAKSLSESNARRKSVCNLPKREFVKRNQDRDCQKSADQAAVKYAARTQEIQREY